MVFLFPDGNHFREKKGSSLYDRIPRARKVWTVAEAVTGQHIIGFSFGTPTTEMVPGPLACVAGLAHMIAASETLHGSRLTPQQMAGFGLGLLAAAVVGGGLPLETAFQWAYAQECGPEKIGSLVYPLHHPEAPHDYVYPPESLSAILSEHWPVERSDRRVVLAGLMKHWEKDKVSQVIVPGAGAPLIAELKKMNPGLQSLPAGDLEDIGLVLKVTR